MRTLYAPAGREDTERRGQRYHRPGPMTPDGVYAACDSTLELVVFGVEIADDSPLVCARPACRPPKGA